MNKLIVEYDPDNGLVLSDNKSKDYVESTIQNFITTIKLLIPLHIVVGTELLITLFQCAVAEGKIKHTEIEFLFKGKTIKIDKFGTCNKYPKGFCWTFTDALETLLICRSKTT